MIRRLFGKDEPLHERLAREGGLVERVPRPSWDDLVGIHGLHRQREYDAVVAVEADAPGDEHEFVVLEDEVVVEEELPAELLEAFDLEPPYRVHAVRKSGRTWALAATAIQVERFEAEGDVIDVAQHAGERTLVVDGQRAFGSVPALEDLLGAEDAVVHAERIDGDLWEVRIAPL
jgi:hypothetical protein